jgi:broad specificity phosphatase PhoE
VNADLTLFVVRHADTAWNRERRYQGGQDLPLSAAGRAQADAVARALRDISLGAVYASPLARARQTAEAIAAPRGLPVRLDPAFREMSFGAWEGRTVADVRAGDPAAHRRFMEAPHLAAPPAGEPLGEVRRRALEGLERIAAAHPGAAVCLVTHAIPARILVLEALGLGLDRLWAIHVSTAGISELEFRGEWAAVHRMNTRAHLDAVPAGL